MAKAEIVITAKDKYSKSLNKFQSGINGITKSLGKMSAVLGGIGAAGLIGSLTTVTMKAAKVGDQFQKMSLRTGASTEFLSEMAHAAQISGTSIEQIEVGLKRLARVQNDANDGLTEAVRSFEAINVKYKDSSGRLRELEDIFPDIVEGINRLDSETRKAAIAQEIFGRSGAQLLPLFREGREGIKKLRQEAKELGITWGQDDANAAAKFNDSLTRLKSAFTGLANEAAKVAFPKITEAATKLTESLKGFDSTKITAGIEKIFGFFEFIVKHKDILIAVFGTIAGAKFGGGLGAIVGGLTLPLVTGGGQKGKAALPPGLREEDYRPFTEKELKENTIVLQKLLNSLVNAPAQIPVPAGVPMPMMGDIIVPKVPLSEYRKFIGGGLVAGAPREPKLNLESIKESLPKLQEMKSILLDIQEVLSTNAGLFIYAFQEPIYKILSGAKSFGEGMIGIFNNIKNAFLDLVSTMIAKAAVFTILNIATGGTFGATRGGFINFLGGFQHGGEFTVNRPSMFLAGERGKERVSIEPEGKSIDSKSININTFDSNSFINWLSRYENRKILSEVMQGNILMGI